MTAPTTTRRGESRMRKRIGLAALAVVAALVTAMPAVAADKPKKDNDTYVQLLAFNDFHGHVQATNPRAVDPGHDPGRPDESEPGTGAIVNQVVNAGGAEYLATTRQGAADDQREHDHRRLGRPHRREPAALGPVPRRAGDRGPEHRRPRRQRRRQPRVRRGPGRDLPDAERRLPPGGRVPGRHAVPRLDLRLPRRERLLRGHRRHGAAALRDPQGRQREDRVHRPHARGHAADRDPVGDRGPRVPRRGRDGERARREAAERGGRPGVRHPAARGRDPERAVLERGPGAGAAGLGRASTTATTSAARSSTSPRASTIRST